MPPDDPPSASEPPKVVEKRNPKIPSDEINPSTRERLWTILSVVTVIILGVPFWWHTTSIERLALPQSDISEISTYGNIAFNLPISLTASSSIFLTPPGRPPIDEEFLLNGLKESLEKEGDFWVFKETGRKGPTSRRGWYLDTNTKKKHDLKVHLQTEDSASIDFPLKPYLSRSGTLILPLHPSHPSKRMIRHHIISALGPAIHALVPQSPPEKPLRALKYSPNVTLSFVLLNEDSSQGGLVEGWDIQSALRDYILPHLKPLEGIHQFSIESQILFHAPLRFSPAERNLESDAGVTSAEWIVTEQAMRGFVNTEQWTLDSGSSNNPVLRFLLFVPAVNHRPMKLDVHGDSPAFMIPQYGGVVLLNPSVAAAITSPGHLTSPDLALPFTYFLTHLHSLLGLPPVPPFLSPGSINPLSPFQVKTLLRAKGKENLEESRDTLAAIVRLVEKIREMRVGEGVVGDVRGAVERLKMMKVMNHTEDPSKVFLLSKDATWMANRAFFNPTMVSLLYFPDEHKYAVYAPLFAPVAVPIVVAAIKEFKRWRKMRRRKID